MPITNSIAELYRIFKPYRLGDDFFGCDHCIDPIDTERLTSTPLQDLSYDDLDHYASDAMTTWGEVRHFKYFLPRLLELAFHNPGGFNSLEILFSKLEYGKWDTWPQHEKYALKNYFHTFWGKVLESELNEDELVDTVLCALGNATDSVKPFLSQWTNTKNSTAYCHLAYFILLNINGITEHNRLNNSFWGHFQEEVIQWLNLPDVYEYLFDGQNNLDIPLLDAVALLADRQCSKHN